MYSVVLVDTACSICSWCRSCFYCVSGGCAHHPVCRRGGHSNGCAKCLGTVIRAQGHHRSSTHHCSTLDISMVDEEFLIQLSGPIASWCRQYPCVTLPHFVIFAEALPSAFLICSPLPAGLLSGDLRAACSTELNLWRWSSAQPAILIHHEGNCRPYWCSLPDQAPNMFSLFLQCQWGSNA